MYYDGARKTLTAHPSYILAGIFCGEPRRTVCFLILHLL